MGINDNGDVLVLMSTSSGNQVDLISTPWAAAHNPGDVNGDGKVDINDLTIVLANYGKTGLVWSQGDIDGDPTGAVDINDLTVVLANYNKTYAGPGIAAVPEPTGLAMVAGLLLAAAWGITRRRR